MKSAMLGKPALALANSRRLDMDAGTKIVIFSLSIVSYLFWAGPKTILNQVNYYCYFSLGVTKRPQRRFRKSGKAPLKASPANFLSSASIKPQKSQKPQSK